MEIEAAFLLEVLLALVTAVGNLPGVTHQVDLQLGVLTEALLALFTAVWLLPGMSPHVKLHMRTHSCWAVGSVSECGSSDWSSD